MFETINDTQRAETLTDELVSLETVVADARSRQATLVRALDQMQVATRDGCGSLTEWVAGRLDVTRFTAKDLIWLSRQPLTVDVDQASDEAVTFDRAVLTSRLQAAGASPRVVANSLDFDLAAVWQRISRYLARHRRDEHAVFGDRYLTIQPTLDESTWRLYGILPAVAGHIVDTALVTRGDQFPPLPDGTREPRCRRNVDALTAICQDTLTPTDSGAESEPNGAGSGVPLVTVVVDAATAAESNGTRGAALSSGRRVGPETLHAILCDGAAEIMVNTADGQLLGVGDTTRTIPPRLRRAILARDREVCTADGCQSRYRLQPHHIQHRARGGTNHPKNLTTLCWYHHHVIVHGHGYHIDPRTPPQRRRFTKPGHPRAPP